MERKNKIDRRKDNGRLGGNINFFRKKLVLNSLKSKSAFVFVDGNADKIEAFAIGVGEEAICGNSLLETGEECDDGNNINGGGCSSTCQIETQTQCTSGADTNGNGNIDKDELNNYIQQYYLGNVNIDKLSNAIIEHLNGCE